MYWLAAMRHASIVVALMCPASNDCSPQSPKATVLPRVALPFMRPLWLLRCLTRFGINAIASPLVCVVPEIDPNLDADGTHRRLRRLVAVVYVPTQGRQRNR